MDSPNLAKLWPVRFARRPDFLSLPNDGKNPGGDDDDGGRDECHQGPKPLFTRQVPGESERGPKKEGLRDGVPTTRVLSKLGVTSWEVSVNEDRDPDGKR